MIPQIRYAKFNCSVRGGERTDGEMTETGDEARRGNCKSDRQMTKEGGMAHLGSEESVGEVNLSSKCADGAGS